MPSANWYVSRGAIGSFNGKPKATAFRDLLESNDTDAFGLPLNDGFSISHRAIGLLIQGRSGWA